MTPEKYEQILNICQAVESQSGADRKQAIEEACAGDEELIKGVHDLLESEAACTDDFEQPILSNINLEQVWKEAQSFDLASANEENTPEKIGPYQILGVLGRGGMSIVYKAQQIRPKREIAVKIPLYGITGANSYRRFLLEAEALGRLHHPGIAQVYDAGLAGVDGRRIVYIAMELVQGLSLLEYTQKMKPSICDCIGILINICEAVSHAHQQGIIHRDLKPSNIIVEVNNNKPTPRILDFGVAKITSADSYTTGIMTTIGQTMGTLAYMSPEQVIGNTAQIDTRSDVYSIGIIAYEMLTGVQPFGDESTSLFNTMHSILQHDLKQPEEINPQLTGDLSTIIMKAVAKEKSQRYRSAAALRDDLQRFLNHKPIQARPPSPYYLARKFIQRHQLPAALAALLVFIFIAGAVGTTWGMLRYRKTADELATQQNELSETATFLTHDLVKNISALAGTSEVRERLLKRLETMVQTLRKSRPFDPILEKNDAQIRIYLSDVEFDTNRLQQSLQHRREALAIRHALLAKHSDDPDLRASISINMVKIGDIQHVMGQDDEMIRWYQKALAIDEALVKEYPTVTNFLDNLSWSYERLGYAALRQQRKQEAADYYQRRLELAEQLVKMDPSNQIAQYGLCSAHNLLIDLYLNENDLDKANEQALAAMKVARELTTDAPDNLLYATAFVRQANRCTGIAIAQSDLKTAQFYVYVGWVKATEMLKSDPNDTTVASVACQNLTEHMKLAKINHDTNQRIKMGNKRIEIQQTARGSDPADHDGLVFLAHLYQELAAIYLNEKKDLEGGISRLNEAYRLQKKVLAGSSVRADDYYYYAQIIQTDPRAGIDDLQQAIDYIDRALSMANHSNPEYWHMRAKLHIRMGNINEAKNDLRQAIQYADELNRPGFVSNLKELQDNH